MGFFSGIRRRIKKIIPKEVRPFIPYAAAMIPGMAALGPIGGAFTKASLARLATDDEADLKDAFRAGALAAAPAAINKGVASLAGTTNAAGDPTAIANFLNKGREVGDTGKTMSLAKSIEGKLNPSGIMGQAKMIGAQGAVDYSIKAAELNKDALERYNADLLKQGIDDKAGRRAAIRAIYSNTGTWDMDEVDSMLDTYGYRTGGRVGFERGGETEKERAKRKREEMFDEGFKYAQEGLSALEELEDKYEPLPIRELRLARGGIADINMEEQIDTPSGDMMMDENIKMASDPSPMDELNSLSLMLYRKPLSDLTEDEYEDLKDFAGQTALKPGLIDEYRNYKMGQEDAGQPVLSPRDYFEMEFGAARMGVKKGGKVIKFRPKEIKVFGKSKDYPGIKEIIRRSKLRDKQRSGKAEGGLMNLGGNNMEDIKGQTAGPDWYYDRMRALEFEFGDELTEEEIADIAFDSQKFYDKMGYEPGDYKKGGRVRKNDGGMMASMDMDVPIQDLAEEFEITFGRPPNSLDELKDFYKQKYDFNGDVSMMERSQRTMAAQGGLMNLGGKEMDLRGGGFVPMGAKERADDVPARLSKNEFVMTADAVRGAGGGSVQKGADLMYDQMKTLEAKA